MNPKRNVACYIDNCIAVDVTLQKVDLIMSETYRPIPYQSSVCNLYTFKFTFKSRYIKVQKKGKCLSVLCLIATHCAAVIFQLWLHLQFHLF